MSTPVTARVSGQGSESRHRDSRHLPRARRLALLLGALAALLLPATASAADSIYWGDHDGAIRVGNLDGTGSASSLFTGENGPSGVAIDAAANKAYWVANGAGAIRVGNLDGTGSPSNLFTGEGVPSGVAIDPGANKIYWADSGANAGTGAIRVGNLDGSGTPSSLFSGEMFPAGVAIDPAANKIYWGSATTIRVGNLDGTEFASDVYTGLDAPTVAVDPAASLLYWTNLINPGEIRAGNIFGSPSPTTLFTDVQSPIGLALDVAANKIYWAAFGSGDIRAGNLDGTGSPSTLFTGEDEPSFPALLLSPAGTGAPEVSGGGQVGDQLSCSEGTWAPDLLGAFLYRAPQSLAYQWQLNGGAISGADQPTYTPTEPGDYACGVTASNHAGSSAQTSGPHQINPRPPTCDDISTSIAYETPAEIDLECSGQGTLTYELVTQPAHGEPSDVDTSAGTLTYTPDFGFSGGDSFTYGASNAGGSSNTATVTITVKPPPPTCADVPVSTEENQPAEVELHCSGQGTLTYKLASQPANGAISDFDASAGTLTYTPDSGFAGTDSFSYQASNAGGDSEDATVSIGVSAPPPPPPPPPPPAPPAPPSNQFGFGKLERDAKRGTAELTLTVPGPGVLGLAKTKQVRAQSERASAAGSVKLTVRPHGRAGERLRRRGTAKVRVMVTFTPDGGTPNAQDKKLKLKLRRGR